MKIIVKLLLIMLLSIALFTSLFLMLSLIEQRSELIDQLEEKKQRNEVFAVQTLKTLLWQVDEPGINTVLQAFLEDNEIAAVTLSDPDTGLDFRYGLSLNTPGLQRQDISIDFRNQHLGDLSFGYTTEPISERLKKSRNQTLLFILFGVILSCTSLAVFSYSIIRPIRQLTHAASALADGDWNYSISSKGGDEISALSRGFVVMQNAIKEQILSIHQAQEYIAEILNSMPSVIIGIDHQGIITQWNRKAEDVYSTSSKEAYGRPLHNVITGFPIEMAAISDSIKQKKTIVERKRRDINSDQGDQMKFEDIIISPLAIQGKKGAVVRIDDVTDTLRMEQMVIQTEKMMSLGGLAAGLAHEINNPLAGIMQTTMVMANRIYRDLESKPNAKAAEATGMDLNILKSYLETRAIPEMLDRIEQSGNRIAKIIREMLGFARESQQVLNLHHIPAILDSVIKLAESDYNLKKQYDFKKIRISRQYSENIPMALCDKTLIQQVLFNLLKNAAEAIYDAGTDQPEIVLNISTEGSNHLRIDISDNGPGISEEQMKRIFDPFYTTKPVGKGTGLGLSVSYFIVKEKHKGDLSVKSVIGKGTTFTIKLPLPE